MLWSWFGWYGRRLPAREGEKEKERAGKGDRGRAKQSGLIDADVRITTGRRIHDRVSHTLPDAAAFSALSKALTRTQFHPNGGIQHEARAERAHILEMV